MQLREGFKNKGKIRRDLVIHTREIVVEYMRRN